MLRVVPSRPGVSAPPGGQTPTEATLIGYRRMGRHLRYQVLQPPQRATDSTDGP